MTFEQFLNKLMAMGACEGALNWCVDQGSIEGVYNNLENRIEQRRWVSWLLYELKLLEIITIDQIEYFMHYEDEEYSVDVLRARLPLVDLIYLLERV